MSHALLAWYAAAEPADLADLLSAIRDILGTLIDTTNFYIALYDAKTDTYTFPLHIDEYDRPTSRKHSDMTKSLTDYVRRIGEPCFFTAEKLNELIANGEIVQFGTLSAVWLGVPLKAARGSIGVFSVQSYDNPLAGFVPAQLL